MAAHHATIAKAAFTAACLRPENPKISRDDLTSFHAVLERTLTSCTMSNIETCKDWLVKNIAPSSQRTTALGKYLTSLSTHATSDESNKQSMISAANAASITASRKRLHILYVLHDLFHHVKHHSSDRSLLHKLVESLLPFVLDLFQKCIAGAGTRVKRRADDLLKIWMQEKFLSKTLLDQMKQSSTNHNGEQTLAGNSLPDKAKAKELPFTMPATHGDPTTPYYDLPAANLMPHIVPNTAVPMRPDQVRALQLSAGTADENLANAVKTFLKDVERMDDPLSIMNEEGIIPSMDEMGQFSYQTDTGDVVGETYYGWTRGFCEKMKKRGHVETRGQRGRSRSPSSSRSGDSSKFRRRSTSRSRSRSHSRTRYKSRSSSYSPPKGYSAFALGQGVNSAPQPKMGSRRSDPPATQLQPTVPLVPFGVDGLPFPPPLPPRPHGWNGPWPPPPPPPPPIALMRGGPLPFPPPPPDFRPGQQSNHNNHQQFDRR